MAASQPAQRVSKVSFKCATQLPKTAGNFHHILNVLLPKIKNQVGEQPHLSSYISIHPSSWEVELPVFPFLVVFFPRFAFPSLWPLYSHAASGQYVRVSLVHCKSKLNWFDLQWIELMTCEFDCIKPHRFISQEKRKTQKRRESLEDKTHTQWKKL